MAYQKIINLLDDTISQPSKFRTRNWIEINDEPRVNYENNSLKLQRKYQVYVNIVMHTYILQEL